MDFEQLANDIGDNYNVVESRKGFIKFEDEHLTFSVFDDGAKACIYEKLNCGTLESDYKKCKTICGIKKFVDMKQKSSMESDYRYYENNLNMIGV